MKLYVRLKRMLRIRSRLYWASRWANGAHVSDTPAVIVGGSVRSGTTLMRTMLDSHPLIAAGPESWLFVHQVNYVLLAEGYGFSLEETQAIRDESTCLAHFIDLFLAEYARRMAKPLWAEKSPGNVTRLEYIWRHFPKAKFIHMIRDGRDVVCSIKSQRERISREIPGAIIRGTLEDRISIWRSCVRAGTAWREDPRYLEVRYEALVQSPDETMARVFDFLQVPWSDNPLQAHQLQRSRGHAIRELGTPEVHKPLFKSSIGRWRRDLSEREIQVCWKRAGDLLSELGYQP